MPQVPGAAHKIRNQASRNPEKNQTVSSDPSGRSPWGPRSTLKDPNPPLNLYMTKLEHHFRAAAADVPGAALLLSRSCARRPELARLRIPFAVAATRHVRWSRARAGHLLPCRHSGLAASLGTCKTRHGTRTHVADGAEHLQAFTSIHSNALCHVAQVLAPWQVVGRRPGIMAC